MTIKVRDFVDQNHGRFVSHLPINDYASVIYTYLACSVSESYIIMSNLDDTQPNPIIRNTIPAPPRFLLFGIIGIFILGVVGFFAGIYIFRDVLKPSQQQRVINNLPFMESFLPNGQDIPTAEPVNQDALDSLLTSPLTLSTPTLENSNVGVEITEEIEVTPEVTDEASNVEGQAVAEIPTETPTLIPTATPFPTLPPTPEPVETIPINNNAVNPAPNIPVNHINTGFVWDQQDWNNCGPTNVTMALSFYGWTRTQDYAASIIRPEREDKNVSPHELVDFTNEYSDLNALWRIGGDIDILRQLVSQGFPVIVETGYMPEGYEWIGHYQVVAGYDDAQQIFYVHDSFLGTDAPNGLISENYINFDANWQDFNRTFIVIYEPAREAIVMNILGTRADMMSAAEHAYNIAQEEARTNPRDGFAFFNMGTAMTILERYEDASILYDQATRVGLPRRMLWYQFGLFEAYFNVGRYDDVLIYVENNLANGAQYVEETYYWQGRVFTQQGRTQEAISAFRTALNRNTNFDAARQALNALSA